METLEICVDAPDDLAKAIAANVDRIELCSALDLGGLTPSPGLIEQAKNAPIPIYAMIRPRGGNFVYSELELQTMESDIAAMQAAGFAGVVFGVLTEDQTLDVKALTRLRSKATGMGTTLHRAVDDMISPIEAVETAIELNFERILTSGGAAKAVDGRNEISAMIDRAGSQIEIMAGSGVTSINLPLLREAGVSSFHASCRAARGPESRPALDVDNLERLHKMIVKT
jgi:copper homeostasis protein